MDLGQVIAVRQLQGPNGESISVSIGMPVEFEDKTGWYCPYLIAGAGGERVRYAGGVDAVQALQLVMVTIGARLFGLGQQLGGEITWDGRKDLGFPSP